MVTTKRVIIIFVLKSIGNVYKKFKFFKQQNGSLLNEHDTIKLDSSA